MTRGDYDVFLHAKTHLASGGGFEPEWEPEFLFDFQRHLVRWAIGRGRSAIFADCGLGKTPMQLVWAENVHRHTGKPVLIVTPLAVSAQTIDEGVKFGLEVRRSDDGVAHPGLNVTNYERLHHFNPADFGGIACDESSAIKAFDGVRRQIVTDFMRKMEYRLLSTATAAPNDYVELGTSSEALGQLGHIDMLNRFFRNTQNTTDLGRKWSSQGGGKDKWRFKGHAELHFWRWVCSWARAMRHPSDLGFDGSRFALPPLRVVEHVVKARTLAPGMLFDLPASGLFEERQEQKRTMRERCERAAELVKGTGQPAVMWCNLNAEGDLLSKLVPDSEQVSGSQTTEEKESAFHGFARGQIRVLVIKPRIGAFGLNWQHCSHMTFFPSHSFEQYYQAERPIRRFGQKRDDVVDVVTTDGGISVLDNLNRKAAQASEMFSALVAQMNNAVSIEKTNAFTKKSEVPSWL